MDVSARFIIVDDDEISNKVCRMTIERVDTKAAIETFVDPFEAFDHIETVFSAPGHQFSAIVFLDINMPGMDGWEFLERFSKLSKAIHDRIHIYIVSSSDNRSDMARARNNAHVVQYLIKPLTREIIKQLITGGFKTD